MFLERNQSEHDCSIPWQDTVTVLYYIILPALQGCCGRQTETGGHDGGGGGQGSLHTTQ